MCGLTGFARHPDAPGLDALSLGFMELMARMEHRGHHATGLAINNQDQTEIYKWAAPVTTVVKSDPWGAAIARITPATTVVQGHVRHATHANAGDANAAHPFQVGRIVGAHNGIIFNWQNVERKLREKFEVPAETPGLIVDSEVAFMALDLIKDPIQATDLLDGYWALTWTKGKSLFLCRTQQAPLSAAYIPKWRALVWHSERHILQNVLGQMGAGGGDGYDIWEVVPGTIYRYAPNTFTDKGSRVEKRNAPFRGRKENHGNFNSVRPGESTNASWKTRSSGVVTPQRFGGGWDYESAREAANERTSNSSGQVTLGDMRKKIDALASRVQALEMEQDLIVKAIESGMTFQPGEVGQYVTDQLTPPVQGTLLPPTCENCDLAAGGAKGVLVSLGDGRFVHQSCIFAEESDESTVTDGVGG